MQVHQLYDEILALLIVFAGLMAAKPVITWLLLRLYNLFIGSEHY